MTKLIFTFLIFIIWSSTCAQGATKSTVIDVRARMIKAFVDSGISTGVLEKRANRMGDETAKLIMDEVLSADSVTTAEIDRVVALIHMSFERPSIIKKRSDRLPTATMLLLEKLERSESGLLRQASLEETKAYVKQQLADDK